MDLAAFKTDYQAGLSYKQLASKHNLNVRSIQWIVEKNGLANRKKNVVDRTKLRELINAGLTNKEISTQLGCGKTTVADIRRTMRLSDAFDLDEPPVSMQGRIDMSGRCPKCGNYVVHGGVRFGTPAPDIRYCFSCGLTNESSSWWDAQKGVRME